MDSALNATFEVLSFAAVIVLAVLGLAIIAGMMGIFNLAHGEFVLLGTYAAYLVYSFGAPCFARMVAVRGGGRRLRPRAPCYPAHLC